MVSEYVVRKWCSWVPVVCTVLNRLVEQILLSCTYHHRWPLLHIHHWYSWWWCCSVHWTSHQTVTHRLHCKRKTRKWIVQVIHNTDTHVQILTHMYTDTHTDIHTNTHINRCNIHRYMHTHIPSWPVQFRVQYIINHSPSIANLETPRFDATNCCRTNNNHTPLLCLMDKYFSLVLRYPFSNNSDSSDL